MIIRDFRVLLASSLSVLKISSTNYDVVNHMCNTRVSNRPSLKKQTYYTYVYLLVWNLRSIPIADTVQVIGPLLKLE